MFAIFAHSGKQYHAKPGLKFNVEKIADAVGTELKLGQVLMCHDGKEIKIGTPHVDNTVVLVRVIEHGLGDKVKIIKLKRRKHHMKRQGHRQAFTRLEVLAIGDSKTVKAPAEKKEKKATDKPDTKVEAKNPVEKKVSADKKAPAKKTEKKPAPVKGDK